ncbi:unnamed protein product [Mytilus edulis]|uniref:Mitochondria-eating protein n=1 Tax=Mytilus edulis TaxID=6550 RepID=A0A8S3S2N4_MYTED|nr:unnamed protein product [Mytilus edulis]
MSCASAPKRRRIEIPPKDGERQVMEVEYEEVKNIVSEIEESYKHTLSVNTKQEDDIRTLQNEITELNKRLENQEHKKKYSDELEQQLKTKNDLLRNSEEKCLKLDKEITALRDVKRKDTKATSGKGKQQFEQTIDTLKDELEGLQGVNESNAANKLRNEKQLVIDHYSQQVQSRDNEIQSFKSELERKENTLQTVVKQRDEERTLKEDERKQKDEALTSAIAGDRLRNNNPGITDLSDPNRPMKIAEKFTEMYDNDWTDSMEALEELDLGEEECVKILLHFLTDSYEECGRLVAELDSHILKAVIISTCEEDTNESGDNKPQDQNIPAELLKPMKDLRKKLTENNVEKLQKKLPDYLMKTRDLTEEHITACSKFVTDCIKYAWMMQIQDPPVYIEWDFPSDTKIDTNILRSYTKAGDHVDFIVWPVLYLHKDGPVLNKGVVQPKSANK